MHKGDEDSGKNIPKDIILDARKVGIGFLIAIVGCAGLFMVFRLPKFVVLTDDPPTCLYWEQEVYSNCHGAAGKTDACDYWQDAYNKCIQSAEKQRAEPRGQMIAEQAAFRRKTTEERQERMQKYLTCEHCPLQDFRENCLKNFIGPREEGRCKYWWTQTDKFCRADNVKQCEAFSEGLLRCRNEAKAIEEFNRNKHN